MSRVCTRLQPCDPGSSIAFWWKPRSSPDDVNVRGAKACTTLMNSPSLPSAPFLPQPFLNLYFIFHYKRVDTSNSLCGFAHDIHIRYNSLFVRDGNTGSGKLGGLKEVGIAAKLFHGSHIGTMMAMWQAGGSKCSIMHLWTNRVGNVMSQDASDVASWSTVGSPRSHSLSIVPALLVSSTILVSLWRKGKIQNATVLSNLAKNRGNVK